MQPSKAKQNQALTANNDIQNENGPQFSEEINPNQE